MDFPTTINSQEEFDKLVSDRLAREAKKYERYEEFKAAAKELEDMKALDYPNKIKTLQSQAKTLQETLDKARGDAKAEADKAAASIADLEKRATGAELAEMRMRIAIETGLDYSIADRLKGTTEEEIRDDAKTLAPLFAKPSLPFGGADGVLDGKGGVGASNGVITETQRNAVLRDLSAALME